MPLFGRRRAAPVPPVPEGAVPGLAAVAASRGFVPVSGRIFDGHFEDAAREATPPMYGVGSDTFSRKVVRIGSTNFSDAFRGTIDGRVVTVANAWTNIGPELRQNPGQLEGVSVCTVEISSILTLAAVQPRDLPVVWRFPVTPTGNPDFDQRFLVVATADHGGAQVLTPAVQQLMMAHDDWIFRAERYLFGCLGKGAFNSGEEVNARIDEVTTIVAALPVSVLPDHIDRSQDDLIARVRRLTSIEDALTFLQSLGQADREQLAQSETPLAAFADVQTPEDARTRFLSLDEEQRMQLLAMFMRVEDRGQQA